MDATSTVTCKNCGDLVSPGMQFCPGCGQSARTRRLDLHHILHDLIHVFVHADKGFLYLTRELSRRPGHVAREYVEGQRKRYFNPFSYLVLTIAVSAFITNYFQLLEADPQHANPVSAMISKNINLVFLASVPVLAAITRMLFSRNRYNYAEHLTLHAYLGGFRVFFYILIFTPLVIFFRQYYYSALGIYLALWGAFTGWAYYQFFGGKKWVIVLKTLASLVIAQIVMTTLIIGVIYIRRHY
jgi:hypothetical protein